MTTFVSVGNARQSFNRLLDFVISVIDCLPTPIVVQHGHTNFGCPKVDKYKFINGQRYEEFMFHSNLLILHAGAGSVIHAIRAGKIPLVMPRLSKYGEHIDDHQLEFAIALHRLQKVVLIEEYVDPILLINRAKELQFQHQKNKIQNSQLESLLSQTLKDEFAKIFS
jgi:UDP-N-acetylglucosamine transferase subunit ALG13